MIQATIYEPDGKLYGRKECETMEQAEAWLSSLMYGPPRLAEADYYSEVADDRPLTDADFDWGYRILGTASSGSVVYTTTVDGCEQPPTPGNVAAIESTHERVLAHPGVRMASTIGPLRMRRRK